MNADVKAQWLAALRSGDYRQGRERLHSLADDTYCCLGVLCDLADKAGVVASREPHLYRERFDGESNYLPASVVAWAALPGHNPRIKLAVKGWANLADRNDRGASFAEIADLIEEHL